ncbi:hypothetical protein KS4_08800 [Poriferisphaera corsica]|uniref:Uncharacterized protein n=1 Tax=Poriferisphaera corsica TaxID=2528020 RepID=A0A517YRK9_9BACT|nr:hypothetical protein KS4_08800 [Poriferisphaera corsica]
MATNVRLEDKIIDVNLPTVLIIDWGFYLRVSFRVFENRFCRA